VVAFLAVMVEMTTAMVSCGGHFARSCDKCPHIHGRGWCNGECFWSNGKCLPKADPECYCGLAQRNLRIVGGRETEVNEYPWQVLFHTNRGEHRRQCISARFTCGGSVIGYQWVLTAAHCLDLRCGLKPSGVEVHLGEHNINDPWESKVIKPNVERIINHPNYDSISLNNDIALLKLTNKIDFKAHPHIRPICLPAPGSNKAYNRYTATVTGWGAIRSGGRASEYLREVDLRVISNRECRRRNRDAGWWWAIITDQMMCTYAKNKDACQGDSGGPVVTKEPGSNGVMPGQNYELIGVVSHGHDGCGKETPGVKTRVTTQMDWIRKTTEGSWMTCPRS